MTQSENPQPAFTPPPSPQPVPSGGAAYAPDGSPKPMLGRNSAGRIALIIGAAGILLGFVLTQVQALAFARGGYDMISWFGIARSVLSLIFGLVALVFGVYALAKKGRGRATAAAGLALGAVLLLDFVSSVLYSLLSNLASSF